MQDLNSNTTAEVNDPILVYTIIELTRNLTDDKIFELDADKFKRLESCFSSKTVVISEFIAKVDFGKNIEETLNCLTKVNGQLADRFAHLNYILVRRSDPRCTRL
jgi:hypothetical protein